jgi:hypothetical protein
MPRSSSQGYDKVRFSALDFLDVETQRKFLSKGDTDEKSASQPSTGCVPSSWSTARGNSYPHDGACEPG